MGYFTNSLELGCDCLGEIRYLDVTVADADGSRAHDPERHLPARGGRRHALEAHRSRRARRGAPQPPLRGVVVRHRRQLRVRLLLVLRPGRLDRVRGQADRHRADVAAEPGRGAAARHRGGAGRGRAVPPAHLLRAPRPRHRRRARTPSSRSTPCAPPERPPTTRTAAPTSRRRPRSTTSRRRSGSSIRCAAGTGRSSTRRAATALGQPVGYKLVPGQTTFPLALARLATSAAGRRSCTGTCG